MGAVSPMVPERSYEQRMAALRHANDVRHKRAELKRRAKRGKADVLDVLAAPPAEVATMKVLDLLLAIPTVGKVKANKVLGRARVSPSKTVGGLSERQRRDLVARVGRRDW